MKHYQRLWFVIPVFFLMLLFGFIYLGSLHPAVPARWRGIHDGMTRDDVLSILPGARCRNGDSIKLDFISDTVDYRQWGVRSCSWQLIVICNQDDGRVTDRVLHFTDKQFGMFSYDYIMKHGQTIDSSIEEQDSLGDRLRWMAILFWSRYID